MPKVEWLRHHWQGIILPVSPPTTDPMFAKLPGLIRIPLALSLLAINIVLHVVLLFTFTLFKVIVPIRAIRLACSRVLVVIAESWIDPENCPF